MSGPEVGGASTEARGSGWVARWEEINNVMQWSLDFICPLRSSRYHILAGCFLAFTYI